MTATEIREMYWSRSDSANENLFAVLREIAAQLAEIRQELDWSGPEKAPERKGPL